ncbi:MAG: histidinol-phosphate transaminase [Cycloclasticus sp. symbiont of Poecilosclerida sp. M]|nr:MAG: histidinol-phosphate transaminase [Cycloclasticus sp. symbiont of Poecilosclerida sp. M]
MREKNMLCDLAVDAIAGLRSYQPGKSIDELQRELGLDEIVKLASNENPLGPSEDVKEAIAKATAEISLYPDGNGYYLKQALADKLAVSTDMITLGNGSNDVLDMVGRVFLEPEREVIYSEYAFVVYAITTQAVGAKGRVASALSINSEQPYGHDLAAMKALINGQTSVIFIANPNNPTGTYLELDILESFIKSVPSDVVVVLDEAYCEYGDKGESKKTIQWLNKYPNLIITRTFSKAYGLAGLRVGYSISQPEVADLLNRVRQPFNVNSLALVAAKAALDDEAYLEETRVLNQQGLKQLVAGFTALELNYISSVGNFICVEVGEAASRVFNDLLKEGVIVRALEPYKMPSYLRVSVGTLKQNEKFLNALAKVLKNV